MTKPVFFVDLIVTHLTPNCQLQENLNYKVYSFFAYMKVFKSFQYYIGTLYLSSLGALVLC